MIPIPVQDCKDKGQDGKSWGPNGKCYVHDGSEEGIKKAIEKATAQGLAEGGGKLENAELSMEYLRAFYSAIMDHPGIWNKIKDDVHIQARGSAGGQMKAKKAGEMTSEMMKSENAAVLAGDYLETDEYIDAPTVFAREGVFTGTNGRPTKKTYEVLKANVPRFLGASVTPDHIKTDTLRPSDRWLGHAVNVTARDDQRDIFGYTRYYKNNLTQDELTKIKNKQYPDGSIGYFTDTKDESGVFDGKPYDATEVGNMVITEYATFFNGTKGACSREMGCGPFQNAAPNVGPSFEELMASPPSLKLKDGKLVKRCPKLEVDKMVEEVEALRAELTKQLNQQKAASDEIITGLTGKISELTTKLDGLAVEHKTLNEAFTGKVKTEEATKSASVKVEFKKTLNAAAATEYEALWDQIKDMNPIEYEGWKVTNSAKLLTEAEQKTVTGKKVANSEGDVVTAARNRARDAQLKRR